MKRLEESERDLQILLDIQILLDLKVLKESERT
jgi:hypothetical protein